MKQQKYTPRQYNMHWELPDNVMYWLRQDSDINLMVYIVGTPGPFGFAFCLET